MGVNLVAHNVENSELRVFVNRVARKKFEPKVDEVTEEWRRLHREELNERVIESS
jgi:hypothetical protein